MLKRFLSIICLFSTGLACKEHRVKEIKNFQVYVESDDPTLKNSIRVLVDHYNRDAGFQALNIVDEAAAGNSVIHFKKGLRDDGRKLGLGQWTTMTQEKFKGYLDRSSTMTVTYGMDLIFDLDNFLSKSPFIEDASSDQSTHLYHLFCHEVGHGLQLEHTTDVDSVMYPTIPEHPTRNVKFKAYFDYVRSFMGYGISKSPAADNLPQAHADTA